MRAGIHQNPLYSGKFYEREKMNPPKKASAPRYSLAMTWLKEYLLSKSRHIDAEESLLTEKDVSDVSLFVTGEELILRVYGAIAARQSVLLTGPRGSGKSYCAEQGIRQARDNQMIGSWIFLQGNREIPRELLSEDMLVISDTKEPDLLKALAMRKLGKGKIPEDLPEELKQHWPAIPSQAIRQNYLFEAGLDFQSDLNSLIIPLSLRSKFEEHKVFLSANAMVDIKGNGKWMIKDENREQYILSKGQEKLCVFHNFDPRKKWVPTDWTVLYLDEINRFGDGFLDSLLSLTEEGKIVRRGEDYYVPILLIATANPPGYDVTAKKLSPPLEARITCSYRVSQPPIEVLAEQIIPTKLEKMAEYDMDHSCHVDRRLCRLAAGIILCLWGDPNSGVKGIQYLTPITRQILARAMEIDKRLRRAMKTLSTLILFGPDARAVGDWISKAMKLSMSEGDNRLTEEYLLRTAIEVLGHKVRKSFNEGAEPEKIALLEQCIVETVHSVLHGEELKQLFLLPYREEQILSIEELKKEISCLLNQNKVLRGFGKKILSVFIGYHKLCLSRIEDIKIWLRMMLEILDKEKISNPAKDNALWEAEYQLLDIRTDVTGRLYSRCRREQIMEFLLTTFLAIRDSSNRIGLRRAQNTIYRLELLKNIPIAQAAQVFSISKHTEDLAQIEIILRAACQNLSKELQHLESPMDRIVQWIELFASVGNLGMEEKADSSPGQLSEIARSLGTLPTKLLQAWVERLIQSAKASGLLNQHNRFISHAEHTWFKELLAQLASMEESIIALIYQDKNTKALLDNLGCSCRWFWRPLLQEWNDGGITKEQIESAIVDVLEDQPEFEKLFSSFCDPSPKSQKYLKQIVYILEECLQKEILPSKILYSLTDKMAADVEGDYLDQLNCLARLLKQLFEKIQSLQPPKGNREIGQLSIGLKFVNTKQLREVQKVFGIRDVRRLYRNIVLQLVPVLSNLANNPEERAWKMLDAMEIIGRIKPTNVTAFIHALNSADILLSGKYRSSYERQWLIRMLSAYPNQSFRLLAEQIEAG